MPEAFLTYAGITLTALHTQRVEQHAVKDESGADTLYTKVIVTVGCVFNSLLLPAIPDAGESPASAMTRVRHMLLLPRQRLVFSPCGDTLFTVSPPDDANGPDPKSCTITAISPATWDVTYTVEFCLRDCAEGQAARGWLSLRWSDTLTYGEDWFATRKRSGTLILSSRDPQPAEAPADPYRGLVTPDVPSGWRRKSAEYTLSANNLKVSFSFVDRELNETPPTPALKLTGRMVLSVPLPGGMHKAEISLRLIGPRTVKKSDLMITGIRVAMGRVLATGIVNANGRMLIGGSMEEDLDDERCAIGLNLVWNIKPSGLGFSAAVAGVGAVAGAVGRAKPANRLGADFKWFGAPLAGGNPARGIAPTTEGTAVVQMIAAALNDPCSRYIATTQIAGNVSVPVPVNPQNGSGGGAGGDVRPQVTVFQTAGVNGSGTGYGNDLSVNGSAGYEDYAGLYIDDGPGVYEDYTITCHYTDDPGVTVAPSTKPGGTAVALQFHAGVRGLTVEFTATKLGDRPTIPFKNPEDENVIWVGGTDSISGVDLLPDGVNQRITVTGIYKYKFLDGSKVIESAPLPPFISRSLRQDAATSAGRAADDILFPSDTGTNTFDGGGVELVPLAAGAGGDWGGEQPIHP